MIGKGEAACLAMAEVQDWYVASDERGRFLRLAVKRPLIEWLRAEPARATGRRYRVVQNDQGFSLPPDLLGAAPKHTPRAKSGELITLVDMDHYIEWGHQRGGCASVPACPAGSYIGRCALPMWSGRDRSTLNSGRLWST